MTAVAAEPKEGLAAEVAGLRGAGCARICTRAKAARRPLGAVDVVDNGIVGTGTISVDGPVRGERLIR